MKNLKLKNGLNNSFNSTPPPPPPPPQHAVNEALTSLFCLLASLFLYACSSSDPSPIPPSTTTHKVTFNPNTPSASSATVSNLPAQQNVDEGNLATEPTTPPALTGYTFGGWYTEASTTTAFLFSTKITKATTLYAKWTPLQTFTISYHANKPNDAPPEATVTGVPQNSANISEGQTATAPTPPTLTGYDFVAWYTEEAATNPYDFSQVITASIDLYAKWNIQQFTITYHGNKPQDVTANVTGVLDPVNIDYNQTAAAPTPPTLTGYNFVAWYTEATATNLFDFTQGITANLDLYAKWSQDTVVSFDTQGGSDIDPQRLTGTLKRATRPQENPTREGYVFDDWYTMATGGDVFDFSSTPITASTTIYARWIQQFTVTYHGNKPSTAPVDATITGLTTDPTIITVNSGDRTTPPNDPTLADYNFVGWYTEEATTNQFNSSQGITANIDLYAKWSQNFIVTFDTQGGSAIDPQRITGTPNRAARPDNNPTREGYAFDNWYTMATGGDVFAFSTTPITASITVYAQWLQQFTITYHGNKPSDAPRDATVTGVPENPVSINEGQTVTAPTSPTLTGYNFVAWYYETTATNQFDYSQVLTTSIHLYAKWTQDPVVTFDTRGGSPIDPQRLTGTTKRAARPDNNPTREDYTFENWYTTAETGTTQFNFAQDITAQSTIVYARWTKKQITVTYHGRKPSTAPPNATITGLTTDPTIVTVNSGETTAPIPAPLLTGYVFDGWYKATASTTGAVALESTAFDFAQPIRGENINLYTKWIQQLRVTYHANKPSGATANVTGMPTNVIINYNLTTTEPMSAPALEGYTFEGWYTEQATTRAFIFTTPITANIDLYAKWTIKVFTVTYNANKPSGATANVTGMPTNVMINYNLTTSKPTPPTLADYNFVAWYTEPTATNPFDFSQGITANIDLYAKWTIIQVFTVTYHANKPSTAPSGVSVTGVSATPVPINSGDRIIVPTEPELTGYNFAGWYTDEAGTNVFRFSTLITANIDLYAKWSQDPVVTFDTQGGSAIDPQRLTETPKRATRPSMNPSRPPHYIFKGWFTTATGTTEFIFDQDITAPRTTVYAQWTRKTYTITFNYNFGEMPATSTRTTDQEGKVSPPDLSTQRPAEYTVIGWFKTNDGSDKIDDFATEIFIRDITLYAKWGFRPETKAALVAEINRAITPTTPSPNLNYIDTSLIEDMSDLFFGKISFNGDISGWNVSNVENMNSMFENANVFNGDISSWNVSQVKIMGGMFASASAFNGNISSWNVSQVKIMAGMFSSASAFNGNISSWNVSQVTNMYSMFNKARVFNQELNNWNVEKVTIMELMFATATAFNGNISNWRPTALTNMNEMFNNASAFIQNINSWNIASSVQKTNAFTGSGLASNLPIWAR